MFKGNGKLKLLALLFLFALLAVPASSFAQWTRGDCFGKRLDCGSSGSGNSSSGKSSSSSSPSSSSSSSSGTSSREREERKEYLREYNKFRNSFIKGNEDLRNKRYKQAELHFRDAIYWWPTGAPSEYREWAYINLTAVLIDQQKYAETITVAEDLFHSGWHPPEMYANYGIALEKFGRDFEALEAYQEAYRLMKSDDPYLEDLGKWLDNVQRKTPVAWIHGSGEFYFLAKDGRKLSRNTGQVPLEGTRVITGGDGHVQMELPDDTTFTFGPGSNMVIDKFVYDRDKSLKTVVTNMTKGVFRWVTGKVSKVPTYGQTEKKLITPVGEFGIRGTDFWVRVWSDGYVEAFLLEGKLEINGKSGDKATLDAGQWVQIRPDGGIGTQQTQKGELEALLEKWLRDR
jgi:hypothetical protein